LVSESNQGVADPSFGYASTLLSGTIAVNALDVMVEQVKKIVAPDLGIPFAWILALNQMVSPAAIWMQPFRASIEVQFMDPATIPDYKVVLGGHADARFFDDPVL
jgi:hypothetical protein